MLATVIVNVNALGPGFIMAEEPRILHADQDTVELTARAMAVVLHKGMRRYFQWEGAVGQ